MNDYLLESRQRLEKIKEEQKREKFLKWASENIKCLRQLDETELQVLKYHYENAESWKNVVNSTFNMAINHLNSLVDYNNDLEKNRHQADIALERLNDYVKSLEQKYGITSPTEMKQNDGLGR